MQASPINAAQLMMEFLDREQVDIGQGIIATEFSKELEKQKLGIDGSTSETPLSPQKEGLSGKSPPASLSDTQDPAVSNSSKGAASTQRSKSLKRLVSDGRPAKDTQPRTRDEMLFTNPVLLAKVLADLKVPAEARKACAGAEDKQGRLSLGSLIDVLDKQTGDGGNLNPGKALGRDVEALVTSLALPRGGDALAVRQLVTKPNGAYSLKELREVLDKAVKQVQEARSPRTLTGDESGRRTTPLTQLKAGSGGKAPSVSIPTQPAPLMASSIPSFAGDRALEKEPGRGLGKASPAAGPQETGNIIGVNNDSAGPHLRPEINEAQRSPSVPGLDTSVVEVSSHEASGSQAKNADSATETFDHSKLAQGPGPGPVENRVEIPREQLAGTRVISMGRNLVQEVQRVLESIPLKGPELMASGKEWSAAGETASLKGTPRDPGLGEPPQQPRAGTLNRAAVTLVGASDTSMAPSSGESSTGDRGQNAARPETGAAKTVADSKLNEPTWDEFPTTTSPPGPSASRMVPPPSRLDNAIDRAEESQAAFQEDAASIRERFSRAVSTRPESLANPETRNADSQPAAKVFKSAFDTAETDGGAPNQQSFDSRGRAFMGYSPVAQGMPVNQAFQAPFRGENLSFANPSWPIDMAQRIQELAKERRTSHLTLELEPQELGRLTLRVETRHNEVTATVTAEKEQAREVLLRNTQALRQNLEQQGLTLGQFLVDVRDERSSGRHAMSDQRFTKHAPWGGAEVKNQHLQGENGTLWIRNDTSHLINVLA